MPMGLHLFWPTKSKPKGLRDPKQATMVQYQNKSNAKKKQTNTHSPQGSV